MFLQMDGTAGRLTNGVTCSSAYQRLLPAADGRLWAVGSGRVAEVRHDRLQLPRWRYRTHWADRLKGGMFGREFVALNCSVPFVARRET